MLVVLRVVDAWRSMKRVRKSNLAFDGAGDGDGGWLRYGIAVT